MNLREATVNDLDTLTMVILEAFAEYDGVLDPPSGAHAESPEKVRDKLMKGGATLAMVDESCAGCVLYYPQDGFLYLGRLAVVPAYRGQQIGQALIADVEAKAFAMGLPGVQLAVRIALPRNRSFFEALGYQIVSYHIHPGYAEPTYMMLEKRVK
jgi:ribosomal protein S18 acetylase RimI-like enzyme